MATAAASETTAPSSASDEPLEAAWEEPAPEPDPYDLLVHLYDADDWSGLRTEALKAAHEDDDARYTYLAAVARYESGAQQDALSDFDALSDDPIVGELAQLQIAGYWLDTAPRLGATTYRAYLDAGGSHRQLAAHNEAYALAAEGRFAMARTALESEGVEMSPLVLATLTDPPKWKRPGVASFLSGALPGAGQLYAGQPREAASAFLVNAIFLSGMAYAAKQEAWPAFGVIAFFGIGFYSGNIYGAADAAIRHNRGVRDDVLDQLGPPVEIPLPSEAP